MYEALGTYICGSCNKRELQRDWTFCVLHGPGWSVQIDYVCVCRTGRLRYCYRAHPIWLRNLIGHRLDSLPWFNYEPDPPTLDVALLEQWQLQLEPVRDVQELIVHWTSQ